MILGHLLDLTLNPRLRRIFHKDRRTCHDIAVQFGLAGAIAADGVNMHACAHHIVGQDRLHILVGRGHGDHIGAFNRRFRRRAGGDVKAQACEVFHAFFGRGTVDIVEPDVVDPADCLDRQTLEFRLRAIADHRHGFGIGGREVFCRHRRHRASAQGRQDRHFGKQHRISAVDI